ncbi:Aste57867_15993 [Aphanomyces stellatus]|uniref:Aste57867_15993 protein n=1 Tax=Aphanomyces stellatus TaxID=120398 RepID=A0A485L6A5_9STRA|nr:hypothetical protein As57867_015937 [Aphanomyces stellatus]VFT92778.1 Aste57867_15993 [Aphanomyces stellatus]
MASTVVFVCPPLLSCITAFQHGQLGSIRALKQCFPIQGIHGRLIVQDKLKQPCEQNGCYVHMDDLPAFMECRRLLVDVVLNCPHKAAALHEYLARDQRLRDVVTEVAAFYGRINLLQGLVSTLAFCFTLPRIHARFLFHLAAYHGHAEVLANLLATNYSSQDVIAARRGDELTYSDVEVAAERGHVTCLELLATSSKQMDRRNIFGLDRNYFGLLPLSLSTTLWMTGENIQRIHALDAAIANGQEDVVACLRKHGAPKLADCAAKGSTIGKVKYIHISHKIVLPTRPMKIRRRVKLRHA